ncbi:MAG: hypothetical protein K5878_18210 [Rhizobiaceae bacterium]|nr:hypothetical protein [Rhizobiaceae bacterium]
MSERKYIAGVLPNSRENLVRWIRDPQGIYPPTATPNLGVTEKHARDVDAPESCISEECRHDLISRMDQVMHDDVRGDPACNRAIPAVGNRCVDLYSVGAPIVWRG